MDASRLRSSVKIQEGAVHELKHHTQQSFWDCGLSCIIMTLPPEKRTHFEQNLKILCEEEYRNQSTWTIDLCYILHNCGVEHKYCTKTPGIDPSFSKDNFYQDVLSQDESRVMNRFMEAASKGIIVDILSLPLEDLLDHLERQGPAIVLISASLLKCQTCLSLSTILGRMLQRIVNLKQTFCGHYIVACGLDRRKQVIYYRDPALKDKICQMTFSDFSKAWKTYGTDDDVILINSSATA